MSAKPVVSNLPKGTPNLPIDRSPIAPGTDAPMPANGRATRTPGHAASGLPDPMPKAPGHKLAGQPPRRSEAGGTLPDWLDGSKAKFTKPAPVSRVRGLQAGTVLPSASIQPIDGYYIEF